MRRSILTVASLLLSLTLTACADVGPRPSPPEHVALKLGSRDVEIDVVVDDQAKVARLVIPSEILAAQMTSRVGATTGALGNLMAGMALTCAMVSGGFWVVRKGKSRTLVALLIIVCMLTAGVSLIWADIPSPPGPWPWSRPAPRPPRPTEFERNKPLEQQPPARRRITLPCWGRNHWQTCPGSGS